MRINLKVVALVKLDVESCQIVRCDELTRIESSRAHASETRSTSPIEGVDRSEPPTLPRNVSPRTADRMPAPHLSLEAVMEPTPVPQAPQLSPTKPGKPRAVV